jgi:hypothetical protein
MPYQLVTPWQNETWVDNYFTPYARLAGRRLIGGSVDGSIPVSITDIPRGVTLLVTGTTVTENRTPSQDELAAADVYYLGGDTMIIDDAAAQILIDAGYSDYLTPIVE